MYIWKRGCSYMFYTPAHLFNRSDIGAIADCKKTSIKRSVFKWWATATNPVQHAVPYCGRGLRMSHRRHISRDKAVCSKNVRKEIAQSRANILRQGFKGYPPGPLTVINVWHAPLVLYGLQVAATSFRTHCIRRRRRSHCLEQPGRTYSPFEILVSTLDFSAFFCSLSLTLCFLRVQRGVSANIRIRCNFDRTALRRRLNKQIFFTLRNLGTVRDEVRHSKEAYLSCVSFSSRLPPLEVQIPSLFVSEKSNYGGGPSSKLSSREFTFLPSFVLSSFCVFFLPALFVESSSSLLPYFCNGFKVLLYRCLTSTLQECLQNEACRNENGRRRERIFGFSFCMTTLSALFNLIFFSSFGGVASLFWVFISPAGNMLIALRFLPCA